MYKCLFLFLLLISCRGSDQNSIKKIEDSSNSSFIGMVDNVYLFKKEEVIGEPFTKYFSSYSNIRAYSLEEQDEVLLLDTTLFSTNQYSDIRFLKMAKDSVISQINLIFHQCPDGDDPCIYKEFALKI